MDQGGAIAQLGERLVCNQKVAGSIPAGSTIAPAARLPAAARAFASATTRDDASLSRHGLNAQRMKGSRDRAVLQKSITADRGAAMCAAPAL